MLGHVEQLAQEVMHKIGNINVQQASQLCGCIKYMEKDIYRSHNRGSDRLVSIMTKFSTYQVHHSFALPMGAPAVDTNDG